MFGAIIGDIVGSRFEFDNCKSKEFELFTNTCDYTHITDDMRLTAAANIDRGIGKAAPQEDASEPGQFSCPGPGGKAENDRLQALHRPQAPLRHRLH